jgi:hypothetical protein
MGDTQTLTTLNWTDDDRKQTNQSSASNHLPNKKKKVGAAMTHYCDVKGTFRNQKIKGLTRNRTGVAGMLLR